MYIYHIYDYIPTAWNLVDIDRIWSIHKIQTKIKGMIRIIHLGWYIMIHYKHLPTSDYCGAVAWWPRRSRHGTRPTRRSPFPRSPRCRRWPRCQSSDTPHPEPTSPDVQNIPKALTKLADAKGWFLYLTYTVCVYIYIAWPKKIRKVAGFATQADHLSQTSNKNPAIPSFHHSVAAARAAAL